MTTGSRRWSWLESHGGMKQEDRRMRDERLLIADGVRGGSQLDVPVRDRE